MIDMFVASIKWISHKKGGRKEEPKEGTRYCPLIRIYKVIGYEEWSIDFICPDFNQTDIICFKFLVNTAPSCLIKKDSKYEIFEGNRKVAEIKILDSFRGE